MSQSTDHQLWVAAANELGLDPETHEFDDIIEPLFQRLKDANM